MVIDVEYLRKRNERSKMDQYFTECLKGYDKDSKIRKELYFSDHFMSRMCERRLYDYKNVVAGMIKYFMETIYAHTTHTKRTYKLQFKNIQVIFAINTRTVDTRMGLPGDRYVAVKTVYDNETDYVCDEHIDLQTNNK